MGRLLPASHAAMDAVSALIELCAKHACRVRRRLNIRLISSGEARRWKRAPKQLLTSLSDKAMSIRCLHKKRVGEEEMDGGGGGGLWQKEILMGEKCQPLNFSGAIYYDCDGKRVHEFPPRSPLRESPLRGTYSFPGGLQQKAAI
ncbi:hypothetical protein ACLOJK_032373 [Asimina triloba]